MNLGLEMPRDHHQIRLDEQPQRPLFISRSSSIGRSCAIIKSQWPGHANLPRASRCGALRVAPTCSRALHVAQPVLQSRRELLIRKAFRWLARGL